MSSPKHLWTGDWEQESADAAADRANGTFPVDEEPNAIVEPPPTTPTRTLPPPRRPRTPPPTPPQHRRRRTLPRPRPRIAVLSLLALLLLAGASYGLTALNRDARPTATTSIPWLGAKLEVWPGGGALVTSISSHSPASSAGLQPGDVIREVERRPVAAPVDVTEAIDALRVGDALEMQFERNSKMYATSAVLEARPANAP